MKTEKINNSELTDKDLLKYNKHILLEEIDTFGLEILKEKHVAIIGLGGLGCPVAQYLSTSGIGRMSLIDDDKIEDTNLQRQILYDNNDIGKYKTDVAAKKLKLLNPDLSIHHHNVRFTKDSYQLILNADIIIDATDNFKTRSLINKYSIKYKKPLIMGSAIKMQGQVSVFRNDIKNMPCYNCLYSNIDDDNEACIDQGVLSSLTGVVGSIQATEAIKVLLNIGTSLDSKLLLIDLKHATFRIIKILKDKKCSECN